MTTSGGIVQNIRRALIILELEKKKNIYVQNVGTEPMMMMATRTRTKIMTTMRAYDEV